MISKFTVMKYISQPQIIKTTCQVSLGIPNLQRTDLRLKASDASRSEVTFSPHDLEFEHSPVLIYACHCTGLLLGGLGKQARVYVKTIFPHVDLGMSLYLIMAAVS